MSKGYSQEEIIENGWDLDDFGQCQDCLNWFPLGELCEREDEDGIDYCPNCL